MVVFFFFFYCKHYFFDIKVMYCCKAFPDGIDDKIFWNKISHEENIKNDNGIKFTPLWEK